MDAGHPFVALAWILALASLLATHAPTRMPDAAQGVADGVHHWFGPLSLILLVGAAVGVGTPSWLGRSRTERLLALGIGAYFIVEVASALVNHQLTGAIPAQDAAYLLYLPLLYWICLDERLNVSVILETCRRISMFVVYASLGVAVVDTTPCLH